MFPWALKLQSLPTSVEVCRPEWGDVSQIAFTLHVTTFAPYAAAYAEIKRSQCEVMQAGHTGASLHCIFVAGCFL